MSYMIYHPEIDGFETREQFERRQRLRAYKRQYHRLRKMDVAIAAIRFAAPQHRAAIASAYRT